MAIDNRLQVFDEQGNLVDYDILASDVKFLPDGKDLPTKLAEMQDDIEDAGSGDGTVTGVKIGSTTYEPTDGVVDLSSPMGNKVDKNGTDSLMTAAEHSKLGNLPTATELATQMNAKANDNAVVKTISVNGGTPAAPVNGNVDISVEGAAGDDGITPHIGSNGNWWIGDTDTNVKAQGPMGSVTITDGDIDTLEVHNVLNANTGLLGMSGAMKLKSNIDAVQANLVKLYNKLANMAFWDAEDQADAEPIPTLLDWSVPKKTLIITNNISNSALEDEDGNTVSGSIQVDQGGTATLIVKGTSGYAITSCTAALSSGTVDSCVNNNDGTFTVTVTVSDALTLTLSGTSAKPTITVINNIGNGAVIKDGNNNVISGSVTAMHGSPFTIKVTAASGYGLSDVGMTVGGSSVTVTNNSYTIAAVNADTTVVISGDLWTVAPKADVSEGGVVVRRGMEYNRTIGNDGTITEGDANIVAPKVISNSNAGDAAAYFLPISGYTNISIRTKPAPEGRFYITALCYYDSGFAFISKTNYFPHIADDYEADRTNFPTGAAYVKIVLNQKGSTNSQDASIHPEKNTQVPSGFPNIVWTQSDYDALDDDFLQYILTND